MSKADEHAMPRWVKVFGIVALLIVVAFVALHIAGLAPHGHGGHAEPAGHDEHGGHDEHRGHHEHSGHDGHR